MIIETSANELIEQDNSGVSNVPVEGVGSPRASRDSELLAALKSAISVADEAAREWDAAPSGMRAGKLLLALCGHLKGYRADIDAIHAAVAKATGHA